MILNIAPLYRGADVRMRRGPEAGPMRYLLVLLPPLEAVGPVETVHPEALSTRLVEEQVQRLVRGLGIAPYLLQVRRELLGQALLRAVRQKAVSARDASWSGVAASAACGACSQAAG
jgi:hypothetical protein